MVKDNALAVFSASPPGAEFPEPRAIIGGLRRRI
jgi:hypothetical protein